MIKALRKSHGFTLIELLIVIVILAILAAVVVPQFTTSTNDARLAAADTTLGNLRSAIDIYFAQHGEYPSRNGDGAGNAANSPLSFVTQLSRYTDAAGDVALSPDATHVFGPYIKKEEIPLEPMTQLQTLIIDSASTALGMTADGGDPGGWKFNNQTGQLIINHATWEAR